MKSVKHMLHEPWDGCKVADRKITYILAEIREDRQRVHSQTISQYLWQVLKPRGLLMSEDVHPSTYATNKRLSIRWKS